MLYRVVCLLALCASTYSLSLGPQYVTRSHVARAGVVRAAVTAVNLETLTEEAALALEGDELAAVATELSVYLFKSPPFQEKAEQPKRRSMVKVAPLAAPQLGSCASSGRAWRHWDSSALPGRGQPSERLAA